MAEMAKQQITLSVDPTLVMALDSVAQSNKSSRSEAFESLLTTGIQAQQAKKEASKKIPLTVRVAPAVAEQVKQVAYTEGISTNEACGWLVERGLLSLTDEGTKAAITELLTQLAQVAEQSEKRFEAQTHRLAYLLSQMTLESMATRQMMTAFLATQQGIGQEGAQRISNTAWTRSVDLLRRPPPTMREVLRQLLIDVGVADE